MYKVLLVDDEQAILTGLRTIVDWSKYGFDVAGVAENGREGLNKAKEMLPDLIMADVRMPGMNGLEMINEVRKFLPDSYFVLLTGYSEFTYAKKAIQLGVCNYLLKPVNTDELEETLLSIQESMRQRSTRLFPQTDDASGEQAIIGLITTCLDSQLDERYTYKLGMPWQTYQVVLTQPRDEESSRGQLKLAWEQLRLYAQTNDVGVVFQREGFLGITLKNMSLQSEGHGDMLKQLLHQNGIIVSAGSVAYDYGGIGRSYEEAKRMFRHSFYYLDDRNWTLGIPDIFRYCSPDDEHEAVIDDSEALDVSKRNVLRHTETGNRLLMEDWLDRSARSMYGRRWEESQIKAWYAELVNVAKLLDGLEQTIDITEIYKQRSWIGIHRRVKSVLSELCEAQTTKHELAVPRLLDFIHRRYKEPLRLEALAQLFHYNSSYLGKLFKKHTGEGFNSYLDKVRIRHAKQLLREGQKVHQVARDVGYPNVDYFHAKFKRYVGQSPSSYRNSDPQ